MNCWKDFQKRRGLKFMKIMTSMMLSFFIFTGNAQAEEKIYKIKIGQKAPFSGTLFSDEAAAKLLIRLETEDRKCSLKIQEAVAKNSAKKDYEIKLANIEKTSEKNRCNEIIALKNKNIELLHKSISGKKSWKDSAWFASGVVSGIVITAISAWSLSKVSSSK